MFTELASILASVVSHTDLAHPPESGELPAATEVTSCGADAPALDGLEDGCSHAAGASGPERRES